MNIFKFHNQNPKGKKVSDCVVRAISYAMGKSWYEVYDDLSILGRKMGDMPNNKPVFSKYLENSGWIKNKMPRHDDNTRYTLYDFAKENKGIFIVLIAHHLTVVENGQIIDTWNCSHKCVGNYWTKK